jgi:hypothetical protein
MSRLSRNWPFLTYFLELREPFTKEPGAASRVAPTTACSRAGHGSASAWATAASRSTPRKVGRQEEAQRKDCRGSAHKRARGSAAKDTGTLDQSAERKLATTVLPLRSILIDRWRRTDEDARQARTGSPQRTQVRKLIVAPRREHSRKPKDVI